VRINWYKAKIEAVAGVISPDRELWMVTHGRDDNPDNADSHVSFRTLAGTLSTVRLAEGVPASSMVLNWSEGAADNSSKISLEGSRFIKAVAQTAKRLLNKCGVKSGGPLNLVGHSWGSLVSENLAMEFWRSGSGYKGSGTKVGRLVALDPAESGTMMGLRLGGLILGDRAEFDGFHGSGPSHSLAIVAGNGLFGSEKRAQTALINIRLDIPGAYISDYITDMDANAKKHALPVDFFYHSIINRNARGISQTIWSLAKDKSSYGVRFPSGSDRVKLPGPLLGVESRYYFTNSKLDFSLGYKGIRLLKFDEFCGVVGVILNQSKQYNKEIWMGLGNAMWNNPPYYDGVTWFYQ
jgi:pimeloyl-ACP methyl ester carboxylesterase